MKGTLIEAFGTEATVSPAMLSPRYACTWETGAAVPGCSNNDCAACPNNPWRLHMGATRVTLSSTVVATTGSRAYGARAAA